MENNFYVAFYEARVCQCNGGTPLTYFLTWEQPGTCECFQNTAPRLGGCSTNIFKVFCAMCERSKARTWLCHIFHPTCLSALYLCPQEPSSIQMHIEQTILFVLISLGISLQISSKIKLASSVPKKSPTHFCRLSPPRKMVTALFTLISLGISLQISSKIKLASSVPKKSPTHFCRLSPPRKMVTALFTLISLGISLQISSKIELDILYV